MDFNTYKTSHETHLDLPSKPCIVQHSKHNRHDGVLETKRLFWCRPSPRDKLPILYPGLLQFPFLASSPTKVPARDGWIMMGSLLNISFRGGHANVGTKQHREPPSLCGVGFQLFPRYKTPCMSSFSILLICPLHLYLAPFSDHLNVLERECLCLCASSLLERERIKKWAWGAGWPVATGHDFTSASHRSGSIRVTHWVPRSGPLLFSSSLTY